MNFCDYYFALKHQSLMPLYCYSALMKRWQYVTPYDCVARHANVFLQRTFFDSFIFYSHKPHLALLQETALNPPARKQENWFLISVGEFAIHFSLRTKVQFIGHNCFFHPYEKAVRRNQVTFVGWHISNCHFFNRTTKMVWRDTEESFKGKIAMPSPKIAKKN